MNSTICAASPRSTASTPGAARGVPRPGSAPGFTLVLDDGSTDETAAIALDEPRNLPQVRVVSLGGNMGYGAALRHGFREARFELLAFSDADGQFDLRELAELLSLAGRFDIVCGYR